MELKKVTMKNVRLFSEQIIEFNGSSELTMPNEGGKSTIADAITFALIGKLYNGSSDLASLKPVSNPSLDVSVELEYKTAEGKTIVLRKEYKENWVKTRGSTETHMQGHTTTCYINEKKLGIRAYEKDLAEIMKVPGTQEINILLNPYFFSENLSWKERLEYIKKVTGEIKPEDVYETAPITIAIKEDLEMVDYDISTLKKKYQVNIKDKKEGVKTLEIQIKGYTVENDIVDKQEHDDAKKEMLDNNDKITNLRVKKQGEKNPTLDKLKEEKTTMKDQLTKSQDADRTDLIKKNEKVVQANADLIEQRQAKYDARNSILSNERELRNDIQSQITKIQDLKSSALTDEAEKNTLVDEWYEEDGKTFEPSKAIICDNCGHDISATANEIELKHFNAAKALKLKDIEKRGNIIKARLTETKAAITKAEDEKFDLEEKYDIEKESRLAIDKAIEKINDEIKLNDEKKLYTYESEETKKIKLDIDSINVSIANEINKISNSDDIESEIDMLKERNKDLQEVVTKYQSQLALEERKEKLKKQLRIKNEELSKAENTDDILTLYSETYLQILTNRVEAHFPNITFKLIEQNIKEGSWNEVCYVMVQTQNGLVPYNTANTASKIKIGVKLANQLANALGWNNIPLVIDNCESITDNNRTFETNAQVISLVAKDAAEGEIV